MNYRIIADSCCDITEELKKKLQMITVPLKLRLGEREFVDDDNLNLPEFMEEMKACKEKVGSASPSPYEYQKAFEEAVNSFTITLSSKLSGSYSSAVLAASLAKENGTSNVHVFDSKSASAGEVLLAFKIWEFVQKNLTRDVIIERVNNFINEMKTYFVLENYDNLQKNGRLSKIAGRIVSLLGIRLVMGADGNGDIALFHKTRGEKQMLEKLLSLISNSGKKTEDEIMVISHCNNLNLAQRLSNMVKERFTFKEIHIVPTKGISSLYADNKGIILAF